MHTFHLCIPTSYSVPYLKSDCGGFHEQNLYCLGISAVYFGRDISIYISYTKSSIRSCIDFSLQAYIYLMKNLTRASKNCLDIKLIPLLPSASAFFFFLKMKLYQGSFDRILRIACTLKWYVCNTRKRHTTLSVPSASLTRFSIPCNIPFFLLGTVPISESSRQAFSFTESSEK